MVVCRLRNDYGLMAELVRNPHTAPNEVPVTVQPPIRGHEKFPSMLGLEDSKMSNQTRRLNGAIAALVLFASMLMAIVVPGDAGAATTGYLVLDGSGRVTAVDGALHLGDRSGTAGASAVGIATTSNGNGYYIVDANGMVTAHGNAVHRGDLTGLKLNAPIVAIARAGSGYLLVGRDGGVFAFGTAFHGSLLQVLPAGVSASNIVDIIVVGEGAGYIVIGDDGGVFAFGAATFHGSVPGALPGTKLDGAVVGGGMTASGTGYALAGRDGGTFTFGGVAFHGSLAGSGNFIAIAVHDGSYALLDVTGSITDLAGAGQQTQVAALGVVNAVDFIAVSVEPVTEGTVAATPTTAAPTTAAPTTAPPTTAPPTTAPPTTAAPTTAPPTTAAPTPPPTNPTSVTLPPVTGGPGKQLTLFDVTGIVQDFDQYAQPNFNWPSSGSMRSPVNYADGRAYVRLEITSKPTSINMAAQVCFWYQYTPGSFSNQYEETCTGPEGLMQFQNEGLWYYEIEAPSKWWSQNGASNRTGQFDWGKRPHVGRIMFKDLKTKTLFFEKRCGSACWSGGDARDHTPVTFNVSLIFVEKGKSFTPPSDWNNNPWK